MRRCISKTLSAGVQHVVPVFDRWPASYCQVIRYWQDDKDFRSLFLSILSSASFRAYRWETPPVTSETINRPFEFVLVDAPELDRPSDETAFSNQLQSQSGDRGVISFPNLGNDAVLVVPKPAADASAYAHLGAFVRSAPLEQQHELWRSVGTVMEMRLAADPIWLSTAGMGVPWLHVRIDSRPKYYAFAPYRDPRYRPAEEI
jgi:hypothetical protein